MSKEKGLTCCVCNKELKPNEVRHSAVYEDKSVLYCYQCAEYEYNCYHDASGIEAEKIVFEKEHGDDCGFEKWYQYQPD